MATTDIASEAQINFIRGLCRERETEKLSDRQVAWLDANLEGLGTAAGVRLTKGQASRVINTLKELPHTGVRRPTHDWPKIPAGRFAVVDPTDGVLKFYKVDRPAEGRWAGRIFLSVQASDELHAVRDRVRRDGILTEIEKDPKEAMLRYGREIGSCGHCGRTLTNEESRRYGIGPICRAKMDW